MRTPKTVSFNCKCDDKCNWYIGDNNNKLITEGGPDYPPEFLSAGEEFSDYVGLVIDYETGTILGWESIKKDIQIYLEENVK